MCDAAKNTHLWRPQIILNSRKSVSNFVFMVAFICLFQSLQKWLEKAASFVAKEPTQAAVRFRSQTLHYIYSQQTKAFLAVHHKQNIFTWSPHGVAAPPLTTLLLMLWPMLCVCKEFKGSQAGNSCLQGAFPWSPDAHACTSACMPVHTSHGSLCCLLSTLPGLDELFKRQVQDTYNTRGEIEERAITEEM